MLDGKGSVPSTMDQSQHTPRYSACETSNPGNHVRSQKLSQRKTRSHRNDQNSELPNFSPGMLETQTMAQHLPNFKENGFQPGILYPAKPA